MSNMMLSKGLFAWRELEGDHPRRGTFLEGSKDSHPLHEKGYPHGYLAN